MQQYVYGNIGHKGYTYLSSDPGFFQDPRRISAMRPAMYYNNISPHGDLPVLEHQSYWMMTSDLGIPGEPEHLFLQASGGEAHRDVTYVHGYYLENTKESYLYGPGLLELMKAGFLNFSQIDALCQNGTIPPLAQIPKLEIQPMALEEKTLKAIIYEILQGHRVMLRLPSKGKAALEQSRQLLLTIYQHLPYAQRRSTGFFTGATATEVMNADMPGGIRLFLLDGDADVSGLGSTPSQVFWNLDMVPEAKVPQPCKRLLNFLTQGDREALDGFFQYCKKLMDASGSGTSPKLSQYAFFLDCYQGSGKDVTDGEIRNWAANLYGERYGDKVKEELVRHIASLLPVDRLEDYLGTYATSLAELRTFGIPDKGEKARVAISQGQKDDIQDIHAALTLKLTESLLAYYPATAKEELHRGLTERFLTAIEKEYPCLTEQKPTAVTMEALSKIQLPEVAEPGIRLAPLVKYSVTGELERLRGEVRDAYAKEKREQNEKGEARILQWPLSCGTLDLRLLYRELEEECYLAGELLAGNESGSWNRKIADQMVGVFPHLTLKSREDCQGAADWLALDLDTYGEKGGVLTDQEEEVLHSLQDQWKDVLALWETHCTDLKDMLALFAKMDAMDMTPELVTERKDAFACELVRTGTTIEDLAEAAESLCEIARNHPDEKKRLEDVVAACGGLKVISESSNYQQAVKQGKLVFKLSEAGLCDSEMVFQPDGKRQTAADTLSRLKAWKNYAPGQALDADHPGVARWLVQNLSRNHALMLELALEDPTLGAAVLCPIASSQEPVSGDTIRKLYHAGWSRQTLLNGAGKQTSDTWNQAVATCFPFQYWYPQTQPKAKVDGRKPGLAQKLLPPLLLGLMGLVSGAMLLLTRTGDPEPVLWWATIMAILSLGCLVSGFLVRGKAEKRMLWIMAASLIPGLILTVIALIL